MQNPKIDLHSEVLEQNEWHPLRLSEFENEILPTDPTDNTDSTDSTDSTD